MLKYLYLGERAIQSKKWRDSNEVSLFQLRAKKKKINTFLRNVCEWKTRTLEKRQT